MVWSSSYDCFHFCFTFLSLSGLGRPSASFSSLVRSFWSKPELLGWSGARVMTVLTFASLFELLGPREVVYGHLLACAVILVQTRASEMVWSSSYEGFYIFHQQQILLELLRPREPIRKLLLACAVILVQTRASEMVWSSSYDCFHISFTF